MDTALFDYELPADRIAATPAARRDESRLLVVERDTGTVSHHIFRELPDLLPAGTTLFRNRARVLPARLHGLRPTGGAVECLLLRPAEPDGAAWWCLLRPGAKTAAAGTFALAGTYSASVEEKRDSEYRVRFATPDGRPIAAVAEEIGSLPLPPYIERARAAGTGDDDAERSRQFAALDRQRYQTVYADPARTVAAAAPTAGLHFTPELLAELERRGFAFRDLVLHVGLGTFQPVKTGRVEEHPIHTERYELSAAAVDGILRGRKRLAVGTTALRAMEDFARKHAAGTAKPSPADGAFAGDASLFIVPPAVFGGADFLLTNFHLPRSTLMCLVAAFLDPAGTAGIARLKALYAEAIAANYRFYSYGDAMLIL
jgi:S-adenosylmethionine:tRNA ribosyltransferase-isomerase